MSKKTETQKSKTINPFIKPTLITLSLLVALPAYLHFASPYYFFAIFNIVDQHRFFWFPFLALVLSLTITILASNLKADNEHKRYWDDKAKEDSNSTSYPEIIFILGIILITLSSLFAIINIFTASYLTDKAYVSKTSYTSSGITVGSRIPWQVANHRAANDLAADNIDGYLVTNTSKGQTALTTARGGWLNNQPYSSVVSLDGTRCLFNPKKAHARIGGWWSANLTKLLVRQRGNIQVDGQDIWAYCDGQTPKVVIPFTKTTHPSILTTVKVPAGIAIYDGRSGKISYLNSGTSLPGPTYPISLAARQREALSVLDNNLSTPKAQGLWPYLLGRYGWQDTSNDQNDPNSSNPHELTFSLNSETYYITPLSVRGLSTAIVARADINATTFKAGSLAPITIFKFPKPFQSGSLTVSEIKKTFPNIGWDTGMKVYEVYPSSASTARASIGQENDIAYQVLISRDSNSWKYCLTGNNGKKSKCSLPSDPVRAIDPFIQTDSLPSSTTEIQDIKLDSLSNDQLVKIISDSAQILSKRRKP